MPLTFLKACDNSVNSLTTSLDNAKHQQREAVQKYIQQFVDTGEVGDQSPVIPGSRNVDIGVLIGNTLNLHGAKATVLAGDLGADYAIEIKRK